MSYVNSRGRAVRPFHRDASGRKVDKRCNPAPVRADRRRKGRLAAGGENHRRPLCAARLPELPERPGTENMPVRGGNLQNELRRQNEKEAQYLAAALEVCSMNGIPAKRARKYGPFSGRKAPAASILANRPTVIAATRRTRIIGFSMKKPRRWSGTFLI